MCLPTLQNFRVTLLIRASDDSILPKEAWEMSPLQILGLLTACVASVCGTLQASSHSVSPLRQALSVLCAEG